MLSFWEKNYLLKFDVIIVGAGITGLSTACSIKEKHPDKEVLILEKGLMPTGASTKNAGFACIGSFTEKKHDLALMGEANFLQLIADRWEGLALLRSRLGDAAIDYQNWGGYELLDEKRVVAQEELDEMNVMLYPMFRKTVFQFKNELISNFRFKKVQQIIVNELEGQINTGLMMKRLWEYASSIGVKMITGANVDQFMEVNDGVEVIVNEFSHPFKGERLIICTNAFTKKLLPDEEINPGRGQVLITNPIEGLKLKGIFSFDEGFYYFRNLGNRILFGGGRNLDFETETTTSFELNPVIQQHLEYYLKEMIIPDQDFTVTDRWCGIMAFGQNKLPLIKKISPRISVGARLNGMGIALGSKVGKTLCEISFS